MNTDSPNPIVAIIEDEPDNQMLIGLVLRRLNMKTIAFPTGEAACEWLRANRPDLVLCDIMLPGMNGSSVLKFMQEQQHLNGVPVVAVTALAMDGDEERFRNEGFSHYLSKPLLPDVLRSKIQEIFGHEK